MNFEQIAAVERDVPRRELRNFLRSARARVDPATLGIPRTKRRLTKGLRIEDLCSLADLSITWYSAFESGKELSVSRKTLTAIADALQLTEDERHYLYALAQYTEPDVRFPDESIRSPLLRLALSIDLGPSMLMDERWTIVAFNNVADAVYGISARGTNFAERMFLDDALQSLHLEWEMNATKLVGTLKMNYAVARDRGAFDAFIAAMREKSTEFDRLWCLPIVTELRPKIARLRHPRFGDLTFEFIGLTAVERWRGYADDTLLVQVPVPQTGTREALANL